MPDGEARASSRCSILCATFSGFSLMQRYPPPLEPSSRARLTLPSFRSNTYLYSGGLSLGIAYKRGLHINEGVQPLPNVRILRANGDAKCSWVVHPLGGRG